MYDEIRGPRMGRGGGDVLVVPVITAMLSADTTPTLVGVDVLEAAREDCCLMPPPLIVHVKLRAATAIAEEQQARGRRWTNPAARIVVERALQYESPPQISTIGQYDTCTAVLRS